MNCLTPAGALGALTDYPLKLQIHLIKRGRGAEKKLKSGQAQGPLAKCVHIPSLSEGIQANPGMLRQKDDSVTKNTLKNAYRIVNLLTFVKLEQCHFPLLNDS